LPHVAQISHANLDGQLGITHMQKIDEKAGRSIGKWAA